MSFRRWLEDCGEVKDRYQNTHPWDKAKSKYVADDGPIPKKARGGALSPMSPESLFGFMKKKMKRT